MRRLTLALAFMGAIWLGFSSGADADYYDYELDGTPEVGIEYTIGDGEGQLTVLGGAGLPLEAYTAAGAPITGTVIFDTVTTVSVPVDSNSDVLYVRVGDQWYEVTGSDPDWNFD